MTKHKKREHFSFMGSAFDNKVEGQQQFVKMAVYWGTACNSLQAQIRNFVAERNKLDLVELIEVANSDMDQMRQILVTGIPVFFSRYPDGVTKMYPVPEPT